MTNLLPAPYQTNCLDYNKIGCKSRSDCIDKCNIEMSLKQCDSLHLYTNMYTHNDKDKYHLSKCIINLNKKICENKFKLPDCINEYFSLKLFNDLPLNESFSSKYFTEIYLGNILNYSQYISFDAISTVSIIFGDQPDTIYIHSPQQFLAEFICFVGGVISLWTGFSVISMYNYGEQFFRRRKKLKKKLFTKTYKIHLINNK